MAGVALLGGHCRITAGARRRHRRHRRHQGTTGHGTGCPPPARSIAYWSGLLELHFDEPVDAKSLLGSYVCGEKPGEFACQAGPLAVAMARGDWVLIELPQTGSEAAAFASVAAGSLASASEGALLVGASVDADLKLRKSAEGDGLVDGANQKPRFSLRTFCRALGAARSLSTSHGPGIGCGGFNPPPRAAGGLLARV